ncbi:hypothetical protein ACT3TI_13480 [Psychrobacter sp. AOP22-C1-22]|uniref:hypothetical protein n=1 Tax=unclassified Psychrobacter TaxID=196806 RepID=UPI0017887DBD|nr:hypothetical protein [Psychrobacter sp. FME6]MBE0407902.1 hypothetical protein [Psychrobacter sp. FME6]
MSSKIIELKKLSKAELKFREAFERLKLNRPKVLPRGTLLSQNNVAKEAGVDPSALRRSRYPELVKEIQIYIEGNKETQVHSSSRQLVLAQRASNRSLRVRIESITDQRDNTLSMLLEAELKIIQLSSENESLKKRLPPVNATYIES